jgi:hypothetical protein
MNLKSMFRIILRYREFYKPIVAQQDYDLLTRGLFDYLPEIIACHFDCSAA